MKKIFAFTLILIALVQTGCGAAGQNSATVPVNLAKAVTISNGDFDLTIHQISIVESKKLGDRTVRVKASVKDKYDLYEIIMEYTNRTNKAGKLGYKQLRVSVPKEEDAKDNPSVVGYCEPRSSNPKGMATFCAYIPPAPKPGVYAVVDVFQASPLLIQPGEEAEFILYAISAKTQPELVISFIEPD
jgi:hypothetical protein